MREEIPGTMLNKKVLIGVTGGIAAYKTCSLVNIFIKNGAEVKVVMTKSATKFVTPLTFATLTTNRVYTDLFENDNPNEVVHINLAKWADVLVIAPATANIIGKITSGIADDLLTTVVMALPLEKKIVLAPAMNVEMWNNAINQNNISRLKTIGSRYIFIDPVEGVLACRDRGKGKIADNNTIFNQVKVLL
jgi:phosphopantothenoylcysteine decarboxylase/phosphopantothenate--cysteine ligase